MNDPRPDCLSFFRGNSLKRLTEAVNGAQVAGVLVSAALTDRGSLPPANLIAVADPFQAITSLIPLFFEDDNPPAGISPKADVDPSARIGRSVHIGAFCAVGPNVIIGDRAVLHPHVTLYPYAEIGPGAVLHSGTIVREYCSVGAFSVIQNGAVIGADGFGYFPDSQGNLVPVPQLGAVRLADRVDLGANSCIDRATFGETSVGVNTKIDNLVQIGHNVKIGRGCILCGKVGLAGSSTIGNRVVLGGDVGVADHITITDGCRLAARSGVTEDLVTPGDYAGFPAITRTAWLKTVSILRRLPELVKKWEKTAGSSDEEQH